MVNKKDSAMKIAFYSEEMNKGHISKIIETLRLHSPQHQYNHYADSRESDADLWHCMSPRSSISFMSKAHRSVISLSDLRFITSPHVYSLSERLFLLPLYRYHCRHAARLITHNNLQKSRLIEKLGLEEGQVEVCASMRHARSGGSLHHPSSEEQLSVRAKFDLPDSYLLVVGEIDTMHGHTTILHSIFALDQRVNVVVYGRRTTHSDVLLRMVRDVGAADRVQFIYEMDRESLPSLYCMALGMLYAPSFESSVEPIVEALHQGLPMILSDTPLNREVAGAAAIYTPLYDESAMSAAIKELLYNESFRGQLIAQCWAEAKRYSEEALSERLAQIYESV
ncbi:MAG: glycosyltransferase [Rikenellaceae bacterium]